MTNTFDLQAELRRTRVRSFSQDLRTFSAAQLKVEFGADSSGRVLVKELIRNAIYQAATWIQGRKAPPVDGNLRSLYYQWVKPILAKLAKELRQVKGDPYDEMSNALEYFILDLRLFRYADLGLIDERWENRFFSDGRFPQLMVFAEKNGFIKWLQEVSRAYGIHAVALGGSPSHLSAEYLVGQLRQRIRPVPPLVLFGVTDYDPSGADIARCFREQLERQGLQVAAVHSLIDPSAFLPEEVEAFRFPVPGKYPKKVQRWLKEGGGIDGEAYGLEADSLPKERLLHRLTQQLQPYVRGALPSPR